MKQLSTILLAVMAFSIVAHAQTNKRQAGFNLSKDHLAIEGYDPVSYFTEGKAVKGRPELSVVHDGVTYHFSSAKNKAAFIGTPAQYEPQYGGWCAYAMGATGKKVEVDPETFKVLNGKLYLFYHSVFNNTLTSWNKDEKSLNAKADANWRKLFN